MMRFVFIRFVCFNKNPRARAFNNYQHRFDATRAAPSRRVLSCSHERENPLVFSPVWFFFFSWLPGRATRADTPRGLRRHSPRVMRVRADSCTCMCFVDSFSPRDCATICVTRDFCTSMVTLFSDVARNFSQVAWFYFTCTRTTSSRASYKYKIMT